MHTACAWVPLLYVKLIILFITSCWNNGVDWKKTGFNSSAINHRWSCNLICRRSTRCFSFMKVQSAFSPHKSQIISFHSYSFNIDGRVPLQAITKQIFVHFGFFSTAEWSWQNNNSTYTTKISPLFLPCICDTAPRWQHIVPTCRCAFMRHQRQPTEICLCPFRPQSSWHITAYFGSLLPAVVQWKSCITCKHLRWRKHSESVLSL